MAGAAIHSQRFVAFSISRVIAFVVLCGGLLEAQVQPISRMAHVSWSGQEGAPQGIFSMAQTPDGLLWVASAGGLYTFDGITFARFHNEENSGHFFSQLFHFLFVSKNGDLWMFP